MVRSSAARRRRGAVAARGGGSAGRWRLPLCPRWRRAANGAALPRVGPWLCCGPGLRPCPHIIIPDSRRRRYGAGQLRPRRRPPPGSRPPKTARAWVRTGSPPDCRWYAGSRPTAAQGAGPPGSRGCPPVRGCRALPPARITPAARRGKRWGWGGNRGSDCARGPTGPGAAGGAPALPEGGAGGASRTTRRAAGTGGQPRARGGRRGRLRVFSRSPSAPAPTTRFTSHHSRRRRHFDSAGTRATPPARRRPGPDPPGAHLPAAPAQCRPAAQVQESRPRAFPRLLSQCRLPAGPRAERGSESASGPPPASSFPTPWLARLPLQRRPPWPAVSRGEGSASACDPAPPLAAPAPSRTACRTQGIESASGPPH